MKLLSERLVSATIALMAGVVLNLLGLLMIILCLFWPIENGCLICLFGFLVASECRPVRKLATIRSKLCVDLTPFPINNVKKAFYN